MRKLLTILFLSGIMVNAQDIHFSHIHNAHLQLNPANAGLFNGQQRASLNFKDQWASFSGAYRTYAASADFALFREKNKNAYMGAGIFAYRDVAGDLNFGTTQVFASLSGIVDVGEYSYLSGGIQLGFGQRSIETMNMQWGNQYADGTFNPTLPTFENSALFNNYGFFDMAAGIAYRYDKLSTTISSNNEVIFDIGASFHHLTRPRSEFYFVDAEDDRMPIKMLVHTNGVIGFEGTNFGIMPGAVYMLQGPHQEVTLGALFRVKVIDAARYTGFIKELAYAVGTHIRLGDAIIPQIWIEMNDFALGVSYDFNTSSLSSVSRSKGGFEISLRYINLGRFYYKHPTNNPKNPSMF